MKLSKEEFEELLMEAAHHTSTISGGRCVEIHDAFINKTLEIEGYERTDHFRDAEEKVWTRYIPNKPHTHPESGEFVLTCVKGDMEVLEFKAGAGFYYYNEELGWTFVDDPYFPLFWRHLPQPPKELKESPRWRPLPNLPVEKEAKNETE